MLNYSRRNDTASALIVAMIAIGVLTAIMATSLQRTTVDTSIAGKWSKRSRTEEIAETGLQRIARKVLDEYTSAGSFNSLLGSIQLGTSGGGQYSVIVVDNSNVGGVDQDGNGSNSVDSDRIFRLVSTGKVGATEQSIEAFYRVIPGTSSITWPPLPSGCPTPPCNSATLLCGSGNVSRSGSSTIDGSDYPYPPPGCKGAHCDVAPISGTTGNYDVIGDAGVNVSGTGVTSLQNQGVSAGCSSWQSLYDTWVNASSSAPGVVVINGNSYSESNDCDHPKVFIIDSSSSSLDLASNTYLCGTFIFKSNTSITTHGTITLVGALLMMGNYSTNAFNPSSGTSNILGKIILRSTSVDSEVEVGAQGSGGILFSSAGMNAALTALNNANTAGANASLETVAWRTWNN